MSYINPDILQEDWDALTGWSDDDNPTIKFVSEIDPAGQLHLDCTGTDTNGVAARSKDIGTIGTGNYYVEVKFSIDQSDGYGNEGYGINFQINAGTQELYFSIGNGFVNPAGDGIVVYDGATFNLVLGKTWDTGWHTVVFYVHNSQTDVDIWVDTNPGVAAADETDVDCSMDCQGADGFITVWGFGSATSHNGDYHIDYTYIGSGAVTVTINGATAILSSGRITPTLTQTISGAVVKLIAGTLSIIKTNYYSWTHKTKNTSVWTGKTKNSSSWTNKNKNTSSWTNKTRH